jgi:thymidylate synthase ThyX
MEPFSNENSNVFVIKIPNEVDRGALMSRYSRSTKSMRQIYHDEFENNPNRGEEFYKKVFANFGDDSIAELCSTQIAIEDISNIAAQFIEDSRTGASYLERSSRYVTFDKFYVPEQLGDLTDIYIEHCNNSIKTYNEMSEKVDSYLREQFPEESLNYEGVKNTKAVYNSTIKAKTLDIVRGILPSSILTNVAINGTGRYFEHLILKMKASNIPEVKRLGSKIQKELSSTIGPLLSRIDSPHGQSYQNYLINYNSRRKSHLTRHLDFGEIKEINQPDIYENYVKCLESDVQLISEINILTNIFYEVNDKGLSFDSIRTWLLSLSINQRRKLLSQIMSNLRQNRRHNLPRVFENSMWRFEIVSSYAVYRDLHRHRLLTFHRTEFNPHIGFYIPPEIKKLGLDVEFCDLMENSIKIYKHIYNRLPQLAPYCLNFAFNYRYQIFCNFRELAHIIELRTIPQGNPEYRIICQKMFKEVKNRSKFLSQFIKFADMNEYQLERLKSEIRTERKINSLE